MNRFSEMQCFNYFRITTLIILVLLLHSTIFLVFISYDLHPLSCIVRPAEEFIEYDSFTKTVELRYSDDMLLFQKMIVFVILVSAIVYLLNAACFYLPNSMIVNNLKDELNDEPMIKKLTIAKDDAIDAGPTAN